MSSLRRLWPKSRSRSLNLANPGLWRSCSSHGRNWSQHVGHGSCAGVSTSTLETHSTRRAFLQRRMLAMMMMMMIGFKKSVIGMRARQRVRLELDLTGVKKFSTEKISRWLCHAAQRIFRSVFVTHFSGTRKRIFQEPKELIIFFPATHRDQTIWKTTSKWFLKKTKENVNV